MTILLRKIRREAVALFRIDGPRMGFASGGAPSLLQACGVFLTAILPALVLMLVLAVLTAASAHQPQLASTDLFGGLPHLSLIPVMGIAAIHELRTKFAALTKEANDALTAAQTVAKKENRALTADELKAQDDFDSKLRALKDEISLEERRLERDRAVVPSAAAPGAQPRVRGVALRSEADPAKGFRNPTEFMLAVMQNSEAGEVDEIDDERLRGLATKTDKSDKVIGGNKTAFVLPNAFAPAPYRATVSSDEQGEYQNRYGGFFTPEQTVPGVLQTTYEGDPTAGRTTVIPMSAPRVKFNARTDKNHATSVSGGFTFSRKPETVAAASSRAEYEQVELNASTLTGLAYASDEVLTDSPISFAAIIAQGFRDELPSRMAYEKLRGLGGLEFLGALNANNAAMISVAKESNQLADTIVTQNLLKMKARCWGYSDAIWIANHNTIPQLGVLSVGVGTAGALVYMPSVREGLPDVLLGRPLFYSEEASTVGDQHDIVLLNMSQYLEGIYQPVQSASSVHVRWVNNETAFKVWLRNAGSPWWRTALTPKRGDTLSPFVTLDARA